jgi:hypothetical protein
MEKEIPNWTKKRKVQSKASGLKQMRFVGSWA